MTNTDRLAQALRDLRDKVKSAIRHDIDDLPIHFGGSLRSVDAALAEHDGLASLAPEGHTAEEWRNWFLAAEGECKEFPIERANLQVRIHELEEDAQKTKDICDKACGEFQRKSRKSAKT